MTIFDVLTMLGGLCLFLFGMNVMGDGLERRAGNSLKVGACSVEAGFVWSDLLTDMERVSDHCSNIAISILDAHEHNMNAHQRLRSLREGNPAFFEKLDDYSRKYQLPQEEM